MAGVCRLSFVMTSPLLWVTLGAVLWSLASAQSRFSPDMLDSGFSSRGPFNGRGGMDFARPGSFSTSGGGMDTFSASSGGMGTFSTSGLGSFSTSGGDTHSFRSSGDGMGTFNRGVGMGTFDRGGGMDSFARGSGFNSFSSSRGGSPGGFRDSFSMSRGGMDSFSRSRDSFGAMRRPADRFNRRGTGGMFEDHTGMSRGGHQHHTDHSHHGFGRSGGSRQGMDRQARGPARVGFNGRAEPFHLGTTEDGQEGYYGATGGQNGFSYWSGAGAGEFYSDGGVRAGIANGYGTGSLQMFLYRLRTRTNEPFPYGAAGIPSPGGFPRRPTPPPPFFHPFG